MKKKLNKANLFMLIIFVLSALVIIFDLLAITVTTFMGKTSGWTWFGFISFMAAFILLDLSSRYLDSIKKEK